MRPYLLCALAVVLGTLPPAPSAFPAGDASSADQEAAVALLRDGKAAEAIVALDKLLLEKPNDDGLKIWKALAQLEQARGMKEAKAAGYRTHVVSAYAILKSVGLRHQTNPDWYLAVGKSLWLNERDYRARRYVEKGLAFRPNFPEAHLLLGDMAYDEGMNPPTHIRTNPYENPKLESARAALRAFNAALALPEIPADLRAEALYRIGLVAEHLESRKAAAREWWEKAVSAAPTSRYGKLARQKLNGQTPK